jgi:hypothetical protein
VGYALIFSGFFEAMESIRRLRSKQKELEILKKHGAI